MSLRPKMSTSMQAGSTSPHRNHFNSNTMPTQTTYNSTPKQSSSLDDAIAQLRNITVQSPLASPEGHDPFGMRDFPVTPRNHVGSDSASPRPVRKPAIPAQLRSGGHSGDPVVYSRSAKNLTVQFDQQGRCTCCPYGFHVNTDFLNQDERSRGVHYEKVNHLRQIKHNKRAARKSMEILLNQHVNGLSLTPDPTQPTEDGFTTIDHDDSETSLFLDDIDRAIKHAHRTKTFRFGTKPPERPPDSPGSNLTRSDSLDTVTSAVSDAVNVKQTVTSHQLARTMATHLPDTGHTECVTISSESVRQIKEHISLSLQRMRELEEQVKVIPLLQERISVLKEEKRMLAIQLQARFSQRNLRSMGVGDYDINEEPEPIIHVVEKEAKKKPSCDVGVGDFDATVEFVSTQEAYHTMQEHVQKMRETELQVLVQNMKQSLIAQKAPTRSIGVGEGNILEGADQNLKITEKETKTIVIGDVEEKETRNVGLQVKAHTRDVSNQFSHQEEKPLTRTIGLNVDIGDLVQSISEQTVSSSSGGQTERHGSSSSDGGEMVGMSWSVQSHMIQRKFMEAVYSGRKEDFILFIQGLLRRSVRSVGCMVKPQTFDAGVNHTPVHTHSVGVGDDRTDVSVKPSVALRDGWTMAKAQSRNQFTWTDLIVTRNAGVNTTPVQLDVMPSPSQPQTRPESGSSQGFYEEWTETSPVVRTETVVLGSHQHQPRVTVQESGVVRSVKTTSSVSESSSRGSESHHHHGASGSVTLDRPSITSLERTVTEGLPGRNLVRSEQVSEESSGGSGQSGSSRTVTVTKRSVTGVSSQQASDLHARDIGADFFSLGAKPPSGHSDRMKQYESSSSSYSAVEGGDVQRSQMELLGDPLKARFDINTLSGQSILDPLNLGQVTVTSDGSRSVRTTTRVESSGSGAFSSQDDSQSRSSVLSSQDLLGVDTLQATSPTKVSHLQVQITPAPLSPRSPHVLSPNRTRSPNRTLSPNRMAQASLESMGMGSGAGMTQSSLEAMTIGSMAAHERMAQSSLEAMGMGSGASMAQSSLEAMGMRSGATHEVHSSVSESTSFSKESSSSSSDKRSIMRGKEGGGQAVIGRKAGITFAQDVIGGLSSIPEEEYNPKVQALAYRSNSEESSSTSSSSDDSDDDGDTSYDEGSYDGRKGEVSFFGKATKSKNIAETDDSSQNRVSPIGASQDDTVETPKECVAKDSAVVESKEQFQETESETQPSSVSPVEQTNLEEQAPSSSTATDNSNVEEAFDIDVELQAACSIVQQHLENTGSIPQAQVNSALSVIQQDWFKVASGKFANPREIDNYLSCFNDFSQELLQHVVNMVDGNGNSVMHYAVSHCNFDAVAVLLHTGMCDMNQQNKAGYTPVMLAALAEIRTSEERDTVRQLLSTGNVNMAASQAGQTALMLSVSHGKSDLVKLLLDSNADVNTQDEDGSTALMCATEHGHTEIVKLLLDHPSCDISVKDNDGSTALSIAMETGHREIGMLLYSKEQEHKTDTKSQKKSRIPSSRINYSRKL